MTKITTILSLFAAAVLTACGGGSNSTDLINDPTADTAGVHALAAGVPLASCQTVATKTATSITLKGGQSVTCRYLHGQTLSYTRVQLAGGTTGVAGTIKDCTGVGVSTPKCAALVNIPTVTAVTGGTVTKNISMVCNSGFTSGGYCQHTLNALLNQFTITLPTAN